MVEQDRYRLDVLRQISAAPGMGAELMTALTRRGGRR